MGRLPKAVVGLLVAGLGLAFAALVVPTDIQQPGTQPGEVGNLESPDKCDNCHGGYNREVEPAFNWRGSMMANAGRDPIFWATVAVAEQDFDGSGDLCIRCHSTGGWYGGRSTPTDGSGLAASDADGVDCDTCHKATDTNNAEHLGVMNAPFIANNKLNPATGYYGTGMLSLWGGSDKLGPYSDAVARHQFKQSKFHRDVDFCGSCHDVSNPAVGDLAHNSGRQPTGDAVIRSGVPGSAVTGKAAFNNFPFQYGVVERTHSEYSAGSLSKTLVSNYAGLPADLRAGAIKKAYETSGGNYKDGTARYFSCQTCHLRAVTGVGCNKAGVPERGDLPFHDMAGGNFWVTDAIKYQNTMGTLRLGGGLTSLQIDAIDAGKDRVSQQLNMAASLVVGGNTLKVTNLTGHKLISGYPEGRRMWLNVKWYDLDGNLLREDGKYDVVASINGAPVKSIVNLNDPNTKIYEAHYGLTKEWAEQLIGLGYSPSLPLSFDRLTGAVDATLGQLAAQGAGTSRETFHFVLNNTVIKDNRIPPYGMAYEEARRRNALPVPASQYGNPSAGGAFNYWDEIALNPPAGAVQAEINLLYQPTSWEYIQFLFLANTGQSAFLANEGANLLDAWLNTGMAAPQTMASTTWSGTPGSLVISGHVRTSGGAGISGVVMNGLPGSPSTDSNGSYSGTVAYGWTGTVTPTLAGYAFTPASRSYANITSNQTAQDYTVSSAVNIPVVSTSPILNVAQTTATGGGNVTSDGGSTVTARGVCWSTSFNPTTSDSKTTDGSGTGVFASNLAGLVPNTLYHVRAYATNSAGTAYGADRQFQTEATSGYINSPASSVILPEVIWAPASGGGTWVTEVQIVDLSGGSQVSVYFDYGGGGRRGPFHIWTSTGLNQSAAYGNLLSALDAVDTGMFDYYGRIGAVEFLTQDVHHRIHVTSRTSNGNYSKTFTGLTDIEAHTAALARPMFIQSLSSLESSRSTMGGFNPSDNPITVEFRLMDGGGQQVGTAFSRTFAGHDFQTFLPFTEAGVPYPLFSLDNISILITPVAGAGRLMCFGATADNTSNDPAALLPIPLNPGYDNSPGSREVLPEVIWAPGGGGGTWISTVVINDISGGSSVSVYFDYGAGGRRGPFSLWTGTAKYSSAKFENLLSTLQGLDPGFTYYGRVGAVEFATQDASHIVHVSAMTANGHFAKSFEGLPDTAAQTADTAKPMMIMNLSSNSAFRSTAGLFNPSNNPVTVELTLYQANGNPIGSGFTKNLGGYDFQAFYPFTEAGVPYPENFFDHAWLSVRPTAGAGRLFCFGATANNISSDPAAHVAVQKQ